MPRVSISLLTDGLQAEREQGFTIDVAYHHFATPKRNSSSLIRPGMNNIPVNMITGASTANLAITNNCWMTVVGSERK